MGLLVGEDEAAGRRIMYADAGSAAERHREGHELDAPPVRLLGDGGRGRGGELVARPGDEGVEAVALGEPRGCWRVRGLARGRCDGSLDGRALGGRRTRVDRDLDLDRGRARHAAAHLVEHRREVVVLEPLLHELARRPQADARRVCIEQLEGAEPQVVGLSPQSGLQPAQRLGPEIRHGCRVSLASTAEPELWTSWEGVGIPREILGTKEHRPQAGDREVPAWEERDPLAPGAPHWWMGWRSRARCAHPGRRSRGGMRRRLPQRERLSRDGERLLTGSWSGRKHGLCARSQAPKIVDDRDRPRAGAERSRIRFPRQRHEHLHEITCEFLGRIEAAACSRRPKRVCVHACSEVGLPSHFASTAAIQIEARSSRVPNHRPARSAWWRANPRIRRGSSLVLPHRARIEPKGRLDRRIRTARPGLLRGSRAARSDRRATLRSRPMAANGPGSTVWGQSHRV